MGAGGTWGGRCGSAFNEAGRRCRGRAGEAGGMTLLKSHRPAGFLLWREGHCMRPMPASAFVWTETDHKPRQAIPQPVLENTAATPQALHNSPNPEAGGRGRAGRNAGRGRGAPNQRTLKPGDPGAHLRWLDARSDASRSLGTCTYTETPNIQRRHGQEQEQRRALYASSNSPSFNRRIPQAKKWASTKLPTTTKPSKSISPRPFLK